MYINTHCPYCRSNIKKISLSVIKPGIITCPNCKKMSFVTGSISGSFFFVISTVLISVILKNITIGLVFELKIIFSIITLSIGIYVMSYFLKLNKTL